MHRLNWEESEIRAASVLALRAEGWTQRAIGERLGIARNVVAYYLRPTCKAAARAQWRGQRELTQWMGTRP